MMMKFYRHYLIYKYNFTFSLFCTTYKLKTIKALFKFWGKFLLLDYFEHFHFNSPRPKSSKTGISWLIKDYIDEDFYKVI